MIKGCTLVSKIPIFKDLYLFSWIYFGIFLEVMQTLLRQYYSRDCCVLYCGYNFQEHLSVCVCVCVYIPWQRILCWWFCGHIVYRQKKSPCRCLPSVCSHRWTARSSRVIAAEEEELRIEKQRRGEGVTTDRANEVEEYRWHSGRNSLQATFYFSFQFQNFLSHSSVNCCFCKFGTGSEAMDCS